MKKTILRFTTAAIALAITPLAQAQDNDAAAQAAEGAAQAIETAAQDAAPNTIDADPALWVVKDEDTTIYMLGTVHFLKPGMTWFDEAVKEAFNKSDSVVLEIKPSSNPAADQQTFAKFALDQSGKGARSGLSDDEKKSYEKAMTSLGLPVAALDPFKPWAAGLVMQITALQKVGFDPNSGVEKILENAANADGKEIFGLETAELQFGIFDSFSPETQKEFLIQTIENNDDIEAGLDQLVTHWANSEPSKLGELLHQELGEGEVKQKLLINRNANWAKWINDRMDKPGTVFMAVGAGHLAGPADVQTLISAYGLKAERINY